MRDYKELKKKKLLVLGRDGYTGQSLCADVSLNTFYQNIEKKTIFSSKRLVKDYFPASNQAEMFNNLTWFTHRLDDYKESGWALLVHHQDKDIVKHLKDLVDLRKGKVLYYHDEKPYEFIEKQGGWDSGFNKLPYYILIAGSIQKIPVELQYLLDIRRAVGRIYFDDQDDYKLYTQKIVKYKSQITKQMLFFAPVHHEHDATFYSKKYLVDPLHMIMNKQGYQIDSLYKNDATESKFYNKVKNHSYDIIFSASHGMAVNDKFSVQKLIQGSLICQDARFHRDLIKNNKGMITGLDIMQNRVVNSKIWFMFACYCAGTMKRSDFSFWVDKRVANDLEMYQSRKDMIAYLPQKLLASSKGPFNIIAHIDPAWIFSFMNIYQTESRVSPFKHALIRMMKRVPVGRAMRSFNMRYSYLSTALLNYVIDHLEKKEAINPLSLSNIWVTRQDAQNYIILGDPAFRI